MSEYLVLTDRDTNTRELHVWGDYDETVISVVWFDERMGVSLCGKDIERLHETLGRIVALKDLYEVNKCVNTSVRF